MLRRKSSGSVSVVYAFRIAAFELCQWYLLVFPGEIFIFSQFGLQVFVNVNHVSKFVVALFYHLSFGRILFSLLPFDEIGFFFFSNNNQFNYNHHHHEALIPTN